MRATAHLLLLSVTLFASASMPAHAQQHSLKQAEAWGKIKGELTQAKPGSVLAFDEDGSLVASIVVPEQKFKQADSLKAFLKQYTDESVRDESNSRSTIRKPDPIAECEEPKTVPPPPECVVCKNGQTICARPRSVKTGDAPQ